MVDLHGRLRLIRRHLRQLLDGAGYRHHHPRGRLRPGLPAGLIYGIRLLQKKIMGESIADDMLRTEQLVGPSGLFLPADRVDELSEPFGNSVHQTRSA
jgi:hypothetical protein